MGIYNKYPYTDFHELNLDWLLEEFFKIKNYFNNLDVQTEINVKLDQMAADGTLSDLIQPYIDELAEEIHERLDQMWGLNGKIVDFFGDSLTWGDSGDNEHSQVSDPFPALIQSITGCTSHNYGRKSAQMSTYNNTNNNLKTQLESADITDSDYVFIQFGTNDMIRSVPIGNADSRDWNCFAGALNNAIYYINANAPQATIIVLGICPCSRFFNHSINNYRSIIDSYQNVMINVCKAQNVKFINMLNCGIDRNNLSAFSPDGTHLHQIGYDRLATCILQNMGGNDVEIPEGISRFNPNMYYSYNKLNNYPVYINGAAQSWTSYGNLTFTPGVYRFRFKADLQCDLYDTQLYYLGLHIKIGDNFIFSPIGLSNGTNEFDGYTYISEPVTGALGLRAATNVPDMNITNMYISDLEIIPIDGDLTCDSVYTINNSISGYFTGAVTVRRSADGLITINGNGTAAQDIPAYTPFINSHALRHIANVVNECYFALFNGTTPTRGQLLATGIGCNQVISAGATITFSFTI